MCTNRPPILWVIIIYNIYIIYYNKIIIITLSSIYTHLFFQFAIKNHSRKGGKSLML